MEATLRLQIRPQQMVFRQWVVAAADPAVILLRPETEEMVDPEVVAPGVEGPPERGSLVKEWVVERDNL